MNAIKFLKVDNKKGYRTFQSSKSIGKRRPQIKEIFDEETLLELSAELEEEN